MPRFINRTGQRFGKLVVVARVGTDRLRKVLWRCVCDCGNEALVPSGSLVTGNTTSCGCYLKAKITKHGGYKKASYNTWRAMMRRCYVTTDKDYARYGAMGVHVCPEWHTYNNFAADMGEPIGTQTLDRIDPYGGYTKNNCRWAYLPTQARNTRVRASTRSGVTGVSNPYGDKWIAKIVVNKRSYYSRICSTIEEAAVARKELELKYWGAS